jgi:hypothetical protein
MRKNFFLFSFISLCLFLCQAAFARVDYRGLMLKGDFETVIKNFNEEKDLKKLFDEEAILLIHTLIMEGKIAESKDYVEYYISRFPKNRNFIELKRGIDLYNLNYRSEILSSNQKKHVEFINTDFKVLQVNSSDREDTLHEILRLENEFYLPSKFDYAFSLNEKAFNDLIEKNAIDEIRAKQNILFPKTNDFYQLAMAYKALAVIKIQEDKLDEAERFIRLAQDQIFKMRSIWLIEDINVYHPILKIDERSTKFASLFPQYLIKLREEFGNFLI